MPRPAAQEARSGASEGDGGSPIAGASARVRAGPAGADDRSLSPPGGAGDRARLRPQRLEEFIGQERVKENLRILIEAARARGEPLDHLLFYGPPGLGKTTLATVIAAEMGVPIRITSGPAIERRGTWPPSSPTCGPARSSSSMRSIASPGPWRRSSTRRWRTSPWTSSSGRGRPPAASA
jgi:hypothetical protein